MIAPVNCGAAGIGVDFASGAHRCDRIRHHHGRRNRPRHADMAEGGTYRSLGFVLHTNDAPTRSPAF
jgi:hypothetical protein